MIQSAIVRCSFHHNDKHSAGSSYAHLVANMPAPKSVQEDEEKETLTARMAAVSGGFLKVPKALEIVKLPSTLIDNESIQKRVLHLAKQVPNQRDTWRSNDRASCSVEGSTIGRINSSCYESIGSE